MGSRLDVKQRRRGRAAKAGKWDGFQRDYGFKIPDFLWFAHLKVPLFSRKESKKEEGGLVMLASLCKVSLVSSLRL